MPDPAAPVPPRCFDTPCPVFPRPGQSRPLLQPSIWIQVDGYLYAYLGVRLERDLYAVSPATSACVAFGLPGQHIPAGAFDGLYFTAPADMPAVVAAVASWHGRGAFVVPAVPSAADSDLISRALLSSKAVCRAKRVEGRMPWMDFLRAHTHLTISIPGGLLVLYASFNSPAKFKKWPSGRPRTMAVVDVPLLRKYGHILPVPIVVTVPGGHRSPAAAPSVTGRGTRRLAPPVRPGGGAPETPDHVERFCSAGMGCFFPRRLGRPPGCGCGERIPGPLLWRENQRIYLQWQR